MGSTKKENVDHQQYSNNITKEILENPLDSNKNKSKKLKNDKSNDKSNDKKEEDEVPPVSFFKVYKYSTMQDKLMYLVGVIGAIGTGLTTPANSFIFGKLADAMVIYGASFAATGTGDVNIFLDAIQEFAVNNALIGVVMLVCSYLSITSFNYAAQSQIFRIRAAFLNSTLHQDISWYDFNQSGEFASRMNEDLGKMEDGLGEKVVMFLHFIVAFVGALTLAFVKGWQLALVCLSSLPVTFIAMGIVGVLTAKLAKQELDVYAKAGNIAEEALGAIRTVKAFDGQAKESRKYEDNLVHARKLNIKKGLFSGMGFGMLWFFIYASYALAFWYGVGLVLKQRDWDPEDIVYTPGTMITVFFSVMMGSMNLGMASPYIEAFGIAKGACAKVYKMIDQVPTINPINGTGKLLNEQLVSIEFKDVYFQYPSRSDVKVLEGLNLKIQKGESVALVGSSGCGKSTCIQLIQRFYDPKEGQVLFNGRDIREFAVGSIREQIGAVGQEPVLFGTTIYENIRYGRTNATKEDIEAAAKEANAHIFIKKLPDGYHTLVGERGAQLSGGQKQRIAIARALVRNPEVLLLDEATSALDTASESKVQAALERASKGRTTIIVAHRLSTIRSADKIVVIDKGVVVESGTHFELMKLNKHYANLVNTQIGSQTELMSPTATSPTKLKPSFIEEDIDDVAIIEYKDDTLEENPAFAKDVSLFEILKLSKTEWPQITVGTVCSIIMGCAMPLFAILFGDILQVMESSDDDYVRSQTNTYSLYFVIAGIVIGLATFFQIYAFSMAGEILTERLRSLTFSSMLNQEIGWFDDKSNGTGSLCARLSGDAAAVQGATGQRIGTIFQSFGTLILGVGLSMYYEWSLGLLALAFTPFILVATYLQRKVMAQENMGTAKTMENCTKLAVEVVSNIRTVVSLGREDMFYNQYIELLRPSVTRAKINTHYRGLVYGLARSLMFFAFAACMYYGGYCVVNKDMPFGNVFKVSQSLIMGTVSIANALAFAPNFQKGVTAAKHIFTLLNRVPKIQDPTNAKDKYWDAQGNVNYDKVEFSYPTRISIPVLRALSMDIQKGQTVALVGPSGCGKSTCIQLIQRFYDVSDGSISIDDHDVRSVTQKSLRKQLGIVSQEPSLFDRSIAENIAYGDNDREVSQDEIINAAKSANIHNFITSLPLGYETRLGEKGTQLSGGQKQRVAIARAMVRNPRILLLDEATSALDAESEKIVQEALESARKGRTAIAIAHRLSTVVDSDVIYVIDNGQVAERGTHKELLSLKGIYYNLYRLQIGTT